MRGKDDNISNVSDGESKLGGTGAGKIAAANASASKKSKAAEGPSAKLNGMAVEASIDCLMLFLILGTDCLHLKLVSPRKKPKLGDAEMEGPSSPVKGARLLNLDGRISDRAPDIDKTLPERVKGS